MTVHHFTTGLFLPSIFTEGLSLGDVPTSETEGENAVWLTVDHRANAQAWALGSGANKQEIRLTLEIDEADPLLVKWTDFAATKVDPRFYSALDGAGKRRSGDWYLYRGTIPWDRVVAVKNMVSHQDVAASSISFSAEEIERSRELAKRAQLGLAKLKEKLKRGQE
jgi:hypothetical protein